MFDEDERRYRLALMHMQWFDMSSVSMVPSTMVPLVRTLLSSRRTISLPFACFVTPLPLPLAAPPAFLSSLLRISAPSAVSHWSTRPTL